MSDSKRFSVITLGCKVNQYEEELMKERLIEGGFVLVRPEEADVVIFNSCAVTEEALRKLLQKIRHVKRFNPYTKIIVTGCAVQTDFVRLERSGIDALVGLDGKKDIDSVVYEVLEGSNVASNPIRLSRNERESLREVVSANFWEKTRAFVKVEDGCDRACTYCAIRLARGSRIRSKPIPLVLKEVTRLVQSGFKEIVLIGVNLGRYGKNENFSLSDLLKALVDLNGDFRIRLSSLNPEDITDDLLEVLRDPKICPHLHISLQSGSDSVLSRMNRPYRIGDFMGIMEKLRKIDPLYSVSTDIIVGFPGETDEELSDTLSLFEHVDFSRVHVFRFSARKGTPAFSMKGQIDGSTKKARARLVRESARNSVARYLFRHIGKKRKVLVEERKQNALWGYDEYYVKCALPLNVSASDFVEVEATALEFLDEEEPYLDCRFLHGWQVG
ncbi:MAG: threonylcarbamoyladenosine tRNA methylthiotransferase MtaB [Thermotogota bacterium]|nr:threonylcarbamoyladenosine tRNA methylthiotransferase MtaB [Thermotogota bacterium]MDK2864639.1 threonylcarbamoyladenosine tRNA methylthiotransferase MtaB [Thermotogota bacterium]HCZ07237.1 tRNA (N(6)-L-threonylcarbamoyladenosine(37)-C(2))-methylthiotransferase MtaB [Thermotogota bacterium]